MKEHPDNIYVESANQSKRFFCLGLVGFIMNEVKQSKLLDENLRDELWHRRWNQAKINKNCHYKAQCQRYAKNATAEPAGALTYKPTNLQTYKPLKF